MEKEYLTQEQYDAVVSAYKERYGYDEMNSEEKERFDNMLDKVVAVKEDAEKTDSMDNEKRDNGERSEHEEESEIAEDPDSVDAEEGTDDSGMPDPPVKKLVLRR